MSREHHIQLPRRFRLLLRAASRLVPSEKRREWLNRREAEIWNEWAFYAESDAAGGDVKARLLRRCWGSFADALWLRFDREALGRRLAHVLRSPLLPLTAITLVFLGIAYSSGWFARTRMTYSPLPYAQPEQLVTFSSRGLFLWSSVAPRPGKLAVWQQESKTLQGVAGYRWRTATLWLPGAREASLGEARVTANFFQVLGSKPLLGRTFVPADLESSSAPVVLSHRTWKEQFGSAPDIIGRRLVMDATESAIIGVMPPGFWFLSHETGIWSLWSIEHQTPDKMPRFAGVVGRLAGGVTISDTQNELNVIAARHKVAWRNSRDQLASLPDQIRQPLYYHGVALLLAFLVAFAAAIHYAGSPSWRYWAYFLIKTCLLLAGVAGAVLEFSGATTRSLTGSVDFFRILASGWMCTVACAAVLLWSVVDQRKRCRVCAMGLGLPVTIGSWGSSLFNNASTELLCECGHGALYLPETQSSAAEPERWLSMDDSWKEMFTPEKK